MHAPDMSARIWIPAEGPPVIRCLLKIAFQDTSGIPKCPMPELKGIPNSASLQPFELSTKLLISQMSQQIHQSCNNHSKRMFVIPLCLTVYGDAPATRPSSTSSCTATDEPHAPTQMMLPICRIMVNIWLARHPWASCLSGSC